MKRRSRGSPIRRDRSRLCQISVAIPITLNVGAVSIRIISSAGGPVAMTPNSGLTLE